MNNLHQLDLESPIGVIEIVGTDQAIYSIMFSEREGLEHQIQDQTPKVLMECATQLEEYFRGERKGFTFPYHYEGTAFQKNVWKALSSIPYAKTVSYKAIAMTIGSEKSVRAVGSANGKNRLSIVIPCHRIIGSNGNLTGYAGGLWRKEWLLQHERLFSMSL
ncbi:methylated-DNA--[protein]-cysteine S-methyltransferase [Caldalkalibacillus mannanilyticus]|uniref:methylated-DNA--[protein]-cysteine S-methyltransferase n=1 Tax=Caldalkalibacillus mannanilyticus TaxID=1418 RepID=UPI0004690835|nr:methylated-DNA--[protein]-cysteine S-methyltransferase [Caldalkalibacillus mannanilyticus]